MKRNRVEEKSAVHEIGIICHVVETILSLVHEKGMSEVKAVVLELGELSFSLPKYLMDGFPAAIDGTMLEGAELIIVEIPARGKCRACGTVYNAKARRKLCPVCGGKEYSLISGTEFNVKEIIAG